MEFFKKYLNQAVSVKYSNEIRFTGILRAIDGYLNVCLEDCTFIKKEEEKKLKHCFLRGPQVKHIEIED
ncbi:hypothetical protein NUSPORA_00489 [Nucleospora cyclopteri]